MAGAPRRDGMAKGATGVQATEGSRGNTFRPDLEGLRGLAILLVLAFHASVPGFGGGFVGVDVFFVLSGFLITGLLLRERERSGRVDLPAFYARRARRILPAAAVVVLVTLLASAVVIAPLDLPRVAGDALASALSVANLRFAATAMDYFTVSASPSPFLHYWSLGVEEQFYLVWPALLLVAMHLRRPRLGAAALLVLVSGLSLAAAVWLTSLAAPWAFYTLPTRAWELGLGGLLAVGVGSGARLEGRLHPRVASWTAAALAAQAGFAAMGWMGLGAIAAAAVLFDASTPYPGLAALLPTLGSAALIVAGTRRFTPAHLLVLAPVRWFGRISYSLYLVHWPMLVLPLALLPIGATLPLGASLALAAVSIGLAALLHRFVEEPFHHGRRLRPSSGRVLEAAGATMAALVLLAAGVGLASSTLLDAGSSVPIDAVATAPADATAIVPGDPGASLVIGPPPTALPPESSAPPVPQATDPIAGSTSRPPSTAPAAPTAQPTPAPRAPVGPVPLPANVRPALARAAGDWEPLLREGCLIQELQVTPPDCVYGDPQGSLTVALVGDSHASQWFPALQRIALANHWRLETFVKLSCRFVDLPEYSRVLQREYTECAAWRPLVVKRLQALKPDLTIVSAAEGMQPMDHADGSPTVQGEAMARLLAQIPGRVAILVDTPEPDVDVPSCLSSHRADVTRCATPRATAYTWRHRILETTAAKASGAAVVDLSSAICPYDPCPAVLDDMIVYRDDFHLTATFSASLAAPLAAALAPDLPPTPVPPAARTPWPGPGPAPAGADPRDRPPPV